MKNTDKIFDKRIYVILFCLIITSIVFVFWLLNFELKKAINALLEVDANKNLSLKFTTSNINVISSEKYLLINLESKTFFIKDIELTYLGNNVYRITFFNDELYKLVKTNSIYEVTILSGTKKIYEILFNI